MSKNAHILCISAGRGEGKVSPPEGFTRLTGALSDALQGDLWFGPRQRLETLKQERTQGILADFVNGIASGVDANEGLTPSGIQNFISRNLGDLADAIWTKPELCYPAYLQVIPYILFRHNGRYLRYVRPGSGNDARLHGKISIGIGGHIDLADAVAASDGSIDLVGTLKKSSEREAQEEIGLDVQAREPRWIATIYATATEVDRVHIGLVGIYDLDDAEAQAIDANHEIGEHAFKTLAEIWNEVDETHELETWTRIIIEANPLA